MTTFDPLVIDDAPNIESHSAAAAVLNVEIETLIAVKDTVEATPVKTILESVIVIQTLVRVRLFVLSPSLCLLIGDATRTR